MAESHVPIETLFEDLGGGRYLTYLSSSSIDEMEKTLRNIKFPFSILSAYGMNGKHFVLIKCLRELKRKPKEN